MGIVFTLWTRARNRWLSFVHGTPDYSLQYRDQIGALRGRYRALPRTCPDSCSRGQPMGGFTLEEQASVVEAFIRVLSQLLSTIQVTNGDEAGRGFQPSRDHRTLESVPPRQR